MSHIENSKQYTGSELANTIFIPMLSGESARELGVRVLYNMPIPTVVTTWDSRPGIMHRYNAKGWVGGKSADKKDIEIPMQRIKAENAYSAAEYFSMVYEKVAAITGMNMEDLTGTELEKAETEIFRKTLLEEIRATMWLGDTASAQLNTFDGLLKPMFRGLADNTVRSVTYKKQELETTAHAVNKVFDNLWKNASERLRALRSEGNLVIFATSDLVNGFELSLNDYANGTSYTDLKDGVLNPSYHGIPIIDLKIGGYNHPADIPESFCLLTDRRNLVMAVNTSDMPGNEVRMWYNPDEMENRQRAVFMAGCNILSKELVIMALPA